MTLVIGCLHWNPIQPPMFTLPLRAIVGSPTCPQHCRVVCRAHMRGVEEKQIVGIPPIHPGQATAKPTSTSAAFDGHTLKPSYALPTVLTTQSLQCNARCVCVTFTSYHWLQCVI